MRRGVFCGPTLFQLICAATLRFARLLMRPRAAWRGCFIEGLFLQAADEKKDRHSTTKRPSEAQREYTPKKATQGPQEKTSRAPYAPVASGVVSCRLMLRFWM